MAVWTKDVIRDLVEGKCDPTVLLAMQRGIKEEDRFEAVLEAEQEKVGWPEKILVPIGEDLYVVQKGQDKIVKCNCGYEFGDYSTNWKTNRRIRVRDTAEDINKLYPKYMGSDPEWMELREYFCPGCFTLLDTESVPPGYPVIFNFLPDIDTFYEKWLGIKAPDK